MKIKILLFSKNKDFFILEFNASLSAEKLSVCLHRNRQVYMHTNTLKEI